MVCFLFLYIYIIDYILPIWLRVDEVLNDFLDVNSGVYYVLSSYQQDVKAVQILLILYKRYDNTITEYQLRLHFRDRYQNNVSNV